MGMWCGGNDDQSLVSPRKSSLVFLTDTGDGVVGAEELSSLVGVSWDDSLQSFFTSLTNPLLYGLFFMGVT